MCYWAWHILWKYINLNISFWMNFQMNLITCQNRWHFLHIRNYLHIIYERFYCIIIYLIAYNEGEHSNLNSSWCYNGFVINSLVSSWLAITFWVWVGLDSSVLRLSTAECEISQWSDWTECAVPCGKGKVSRERQIIVNAPDCPTNLFEEKDCDNGNCSKYSATGVYYWQPYQNIVEKCWLNIC